MEFDPVTELQRTFALVRPVGMTDSAARDWLAAAVGEVVHLPPALLASACAEARKTVTHHGQIVPAILSSKAIAQQDAHEREVRRLQRDGHHIEGRAPVPVEHRGVTKRIGDIKLIENNGASR